MEILVAHNTKTAHPRKNQHQLGKLCDDGALHATYAALLDHPAQYDQPAYTRQLAERTRHEILG